MFDFIHHFNGYFYYLPWKLGKPAALKATYRAKRSRKQALKRRGGPKIFQVRRLVVSVPKDAKSQIYDAISKAPSGFSVCEKKIWNNRWTPHYPSQ